MKQLIALGIALIVLMVASPVAAQVNDPVPVFGHNEIVVGQALVLPLRLDSLPSGLTGFTISVSTSDHDVVAIIGVIVPSADGVVNLSPPVTSLTYGYTDLADVFPIGAAFPLLAEIHVIGIGSGQASIDVVFVLADDDFAETLTISPTSTLVVVP